MTSFTFRLHPVGPIVAFAGVFYARAAAAEVLRGYREYFADAPDEVSAEAFAITMPAAPTLPEPVHDQECFVIGAVHAGDPEEGMRVLQPLRELATPLADISQPLPFTFVSPPSTASSRVVGKLTDADSDAANIAWVREAWSEIDGLGTGGTYVNFGEEGDDTTSCAFGPNLERLARIKAVYDPDNVFRRTNNIRPAAGG